MLRKGTGSLPLNVVLWTACAVTAMEHHGLRPDFDPAQPVVGVWFDTGRGQTILSQDNRPRGLTRCRLTRNQICGSFLDGFRQDPR